VHTLQKIQRGFKQYLEDVYKNKDSDKYSDKGSSSSPDPSQESPRNLSSAASITTKQDPAQPRPSELSVSVNTNVQGHSLMQPSIYYSPSPEYYTEYSALSQLDMSGANTNNPQNTQQGLYRPDEQMYDRSYEVYQRPPHVHTPGLPQSMTGHTLPVEYVHERYEMQRGYIAYPPQEYANTTEPHNQSYGVVPNMYRPSTSFQYQPYNMPQHSTGVTPHAINLQSIQQQPNSLRGNVPSYVGIPPLNVNFSANTSNVGQEENYEDE